MKRALLCSAFAALLTGCGLCPSPPSAATGTAARYPITDVATAPATPVRNQAKSGTCWTFGGVSHHSRAKRSAPDGARSISRRCGVVRHAYFEKAVKYVRTRGRAAFRSGRRNSGRAVAGRPLRHRASIPLRRRSGPTAPTTTPRWRRRSGGWRSGSSTKNCMKRSIGSG